MSTPRTAMPPDSRTRRPTSRCLPRLTTPSPLPRAPPSFVCCLPFCLLRFAQHGLPCLHQGQSCLHRGPLRLPLPTCSPSPFSCPLRFAMPTPKIAMSTPEIAKSTPRIDMSTSETAISTPKTAQDVFRFRQRPPYVDFFLLRSRSRFS